MSTKADASAEGRAPMSALSPVLARLRSAALPAIDVALAPLAGAASRILKLARRITLQRLPLTRRAVAWGGTYPLIDHYYEPLIHPERVVGALDRPRPLPGLDLRIDEASRLLSELGRAAGLTAALEREPALRDYRLDNPSFPGGDADVLHAMIRRLRPRAVIEIGCGNSTRVVAAALAENRRDGGAPARHLCIEPYEAPWLGETGAEILRQTVEAVDPALFASLGRDDILFIDSSHMIRPQGDVTVELLQIVPALAPGVMIHVHDIFTPRDYPANLIVDHRVFWNEQYLLEAFLQFNEKFEVILPLNHLWRERPDLVAQACPGLARSGGAAPASFWLRRRP
jgi:hypothetical protein